MVNTARREKTAAGSSYVCFPTTVLTASGDEG